MRAAASKITGVSVICSIVCSGADQRRMFEDDFPRFWNNTVSADGPGQLGTRTFHDEVITKFAFCMYTGRVNTRFYKD